MRLDSIRLLGPRTLGIAVCAVVCTACGPAVIDYELVETSTGAQLKIERFSETLSANGEPALLLRYRTELDLADVSALEREVAIVWDYLRPRVEARGFRMAIIQAARWEPPSWQRQGAAAQYVVKRSLGGGGRGSSTRSGDGIWQLQPNPLEAEAS